MGAQKGVNCFFKMVDHFAQMGQKLSTGPTTVDNLMSVISPACFCLLLLLATKHVMLYCFLNYALCRALNEGYGLKIKREERKERLFFLHASNRPSLLLFLLLALVYFFFLLEKQAANFPSLLPFFLCWSLVVRRPAYIHKNKPTALVHFRWDRLTHIHRNILVWLRRGLTWSLASMRED